MNQIKNVFNEIDAERATRLAGDAPTCSCKPKPLNGQHWTGCPEGKVEEAQRALVRWLEKWELIDNSDANVALRLAMDEIFDEKENADLLAILRPYFPPASQTPKFGIYIASKTKHAQKWKDLRAAGEPIISTWIDESGIGETKSFEDLWRRCIDEATSAERLVVYAEEGDELKGALVEVGAALASGTPVWIVGTVEALKTARNHRLMRKAASIKEAFSGVHTLATPASTARTDGWKPIETAPKNGRHIQAADFSGKGVGFGGNPPQSYQCVVHWWEWCDGTHQEEWGWYPSTGAGESNALTNLTHWRELDEPAAPGSVPPHDPEKDFRDKCIGNWEGVPQAEPPK